MDVHYMKRKLVVEYRPFRTTAPGGQCFMQSLTDLVQAFQSRQLLTRSYILLDDAIRFLWSAGDTPDYSAQHFRDSLLEYTSKCMKHYKAELPGTFRVGLMDFIGTRTDLRDEFMKIILKEPPIITVFITAQYTQAVQVTFQTSKSFPDLIRSVPYSDIIANPYLSIIRGHLELQGTINAFHGKLW